VVVFGSAFTSIVSIFYVRGPCKRARHGYWPAPYWAHSRLSCRGTLDTDGDPVCLLSASSTGAEIEAERA